MIIVMVMVKHIYSYIVHIILIIFIIDHDDGVAPAMPLPLSSFDDQQALHAPPLLVALSQP